MFPKYRLFAPGPTPIPEKVALAMAAPLYHHRTPAFEAIVAEVRQGLSWLFQTQKDVLLFAASGSGAMEAALVNCVGPGDAVLCINGGKFGERWGKMCQAHQLAFQEISVEWGRAVDPALVEAALSQKKFRAVCVQASETSTGVAHPIKVLASLVAKYDDTILIVDGITGVGVMDLPMDDWGIDILISGSQKALMLPPGLAFAAVSEKAMQMARQKKAGRFYFDFIAEAAALKNNTTAWTPAISLIVGLREVLTSLKSIGLPALFAHYDNLMQGLRDAAVASGLGLFAPDSPSPAVTAIGMPSGLDSTVLIKQLRDQYQMTIAEGQDQAKGKIFRIGHLGYYDIFDMITVWSAVEMTLAKMGHRFSPGAGIAAMMKRFGA